MSQILDNSPPCGNAHNARWLPVVMSRLRLDARWLTVIAMMALAAAIFFGWRAMWSITLATLGAVVMHFILARIVRVIRDHHQPQPLLHVLKLGLLTGLCLPVFVDPLIPLLAGGATGALSLLVGRSHRVRLHVVALVVLSVWFIPAVVRGGGPSQATRTFFAWHTHVLAPDSIVTGDLVTSHPRLSQQLWWQQPAPPTGDTALAMKDVGLLVLRERSRMIEHEWVMVNMLSSGELPRLEDLLLGALPGPVGATSRALLLAMTLYLIYRRLSRWSVPVYAMLSAGMTLMVMVAVFADRDMLVIARLMQIKPAIAVTYITYMLLGTPLLLIFGILAPMTMPITPWGRAVYGILLGAFAMAAMWVTGVPAAAFFALVVVSLASRQLDRLRFGRFAT